MSRLKAEGLRAAVRAIYDQHGYLTAALVVQEARPETHPLHGHVFDCPSGTAAERYYQEQAAKLIRKLYVTYRPADETSQARQVRAWINLPTDRGQVYEPSEQVALDPLKSRLALQAMEREYHQLEERFGHTREFFALASATVKRGRKRREGGKGRKAA